MAGTPKRSRAARVEVHVGPGLAGDDGDAVEGDTVVGKAADALGDGVELAFDVRGGDGGETCDAVRRGDPARSRSG